MYEYLADSDFLLKLDSLQNKKLYARIFSLDLNNIVQEEITGNITSGSINIDGSSIVRRTCSISMVSKEIKLTEYYWTLKTKFKLEIGIQNTIDSKYPEIIWFNQGIYLISSFSASLGTNNFSISIQGKDKMAKLNGDYGGAFPFEINLGEVEIENNDGTISKEAIPIKDIITKLVHVYAEEPYHNIIIEDIPDYGYSLLEYKGNENTGMYILLNENNEGENVVIKSDNVQVQLLKDNGVYENCYLKSIPNYNTLNNLYQENPEAILPSKIKLKENTNGTVLKPEYGQAIAYERTELVYNGELIAKAGETITSVLDKIQNMLGQYEYFYDADGRFIFRQKRNYIQMFYSPIKTDNDNNIIYINNNEYGYNFTNTNLITQISNNPNIANIKNDFVVWGTREGVSGGKIPIHIRIAIDDKPIEYKQIEFTEKDLDILKIEYPQLFEKKDGESDEEFNIRNWTSRTPKTFRIQSSLNTIENDQIVFTDWREIIYQMAEDYSKCGLILPDFNLRVAAANPLLYPYGITGYEQYYEDILSNWRDLYDGKEWTNALESPETLNFWFDFLNASNSELSKFSVKTIGHRPKVVNDSQVKVIYYRNVPNILFSQQPINDNLEYTEIKINQQIRDLFTVSSQGKSGYEAIEELVSSHTNAMENISITSLPIYYLEPNVLIELGDETINLKKEKYLMTKLSYQMGANASMSLSCVKIQETLI